MSAATFQLPHKFTSVLVQGASRGIGLEFTKQLLRNHKVPLVFATCRTPTNEIQALQSNFRENLHIFPLDLNDEYSIFKAADQTQQILKDHNCSNLQCLINCSGILHEKSTGMEPERSLKMVNENWLKILFQTHSIGPLLVLKHFHELLASQTSNPSIVANMSARVASIGDNGLGGWYGYRASKCALNQITKCASIELQRKNIITFALHPGTVNTNLSQPFHKNSKVLLDVEESVTCLLDIILNASRSMNGGYYDWKKQAIPW